MDSKKSWKEAKDFCLPIELGTPSDDNFDVTKVSLAANILLDRTHDVTYHSSVDGKTHVEDRCASLIVLDNLFGEQERSEMMKYMTSETWTPSDPLPTDKWECLTADGPGMKPTMGLTDAALSGLARVPAVQEVIRRLALLYPDYVIASQPPNECFVPTEYELDPLNTCFDFVGNAALSHENFRWHMDADPCSFPDSPWTNVFGHYTNHEPGKPLFVTLLLYLDDFWPRNYDAETLFLDDDTETGVFIRPKAYRALLMDMDVFHRLSPPSYKAQRPRFSLVRKLLFWPRKRIRSKTGQRYLTSKNTVDAVSFKGNTVISLTRPEFGIPTLIGSANALPRQLTIKVPEFADAEDVDSRAPAPLYKRKHDEITPEAKR